MAGRLRRFVGLPFVEQRLVLASACAVAALSLVLALFGLRRTLSWVLRPPRRPVSSGGVDARRTAELVNAAATMPLLGASCLTRSLALLWLLKRRHWPGELRIGVRVLPEGLTAHAWVESDGTALNDHPDVGQRYTVLENPAASGLDWA